MVANNDTPALDEALVEDEPLEVDLDQIELTEVELTPTQIQALRAVFSELQTAHNSGPGIISIEYDPSYDDGNQVAAFIQFPPEAVPPTPR